MVGSASDKNGAELNLKNEPVFKNRADGDEWCDGGWPDGTINGVHVICVRFSIHFLPSGKKRSAAASRDVTVYSIKIIRKFNL